MRGEIPDRTLEKLLNSNLKNVALTAAVGHWNAARRERVTGQFQEQWRKVITQSGIDDLGNTHIDYWIGKILSKDGELGRDWLITQTNREDGYLSFQVGKIAEKAIPALSKSQRIEVLRQVRSGFGSEKIVSQLIGNDLESYRLLLDLEELSRYHLAPLEGLSGQDWPEKALMALDAGYGPDKIVVASLPRSWSWSGNESRLWDQWNCKFEKLLDHPDPRITRIGQLGTEISKARWDHAIEQERHEDIYGI